MAKKNNIVKAEQVSLQPLENIENLIHVIRGKQVMLDRDLARLYGVETFRLNEQVKRNIERFPDDFMFQLSKEEFENWKSQIVTSNNSENLKSQIAISSGDKILKSQIAISGWGGTRKRPYAFTESGVAMLSGVLRSPQAVSVNIQIMRAFAAMRRFLASNAQVFQRLEVMERTQLSLLAHQESTDQKVEEILCQISRKNMRKILSFIIVLVLLTPSAMAQEDLQKGGEPWGEQGDYKGIWYMSRDYMLLNTTYLFLNRHALPKNLATQMTTNY